MQLEKYATTSSSQHTGYTFISVGEQGRIIKATATKGCTAVTATTVGQNNTPPQLTALPSACNPATNQYTVSGTVTLSGPVLGDDLSTRILNGRGYPKRLWFDEPDLRELYFLGFTTPLTGIIYNLTIDSETIAQHVAKNNLVPV